MRLIHSLRNAAMGLVQYSVALILGFIGRSVFIRMLGINYQGLNSLFTSIISMLNVAELGIGLTLVFSMYPYIAQNDIGVIKAIMRLYKWAYRGVAAVVAVAGLLLILFLHDFSTYKGIHDNIYFIYLLFLATSVSSYLVSYKRSIIYAHQENSIISYYDLLLAVVVNVAQIIILLRFKNFILYLLVALIFGLIENIWVSHVANRNYPYLKEKDIPKLPHQLFRNIRKQVYGMLYHSLATYIVFGTDSIIISYFFGLTVLGLYSNYTLISTYLGNFLAQAIQGVIPSVGNLLTEDNPKKSFDTYKKISFASFWLLTICSVGLFVVMKPFIIIWLGHNYLLSGTVLLVIVYNFYVLGMRRPIAVFQDAMGIYYENRHVPVLESVVNLAASLTLVHFFGLEGVLMGTLVSTMILYGYSFPKYVYVPLFKKKNSSYVREQLFYLFLFSIILAISVLISNLLANGNNIWQNFIVNILISLLIPNALLFLIFRRSDNFRYFVEVFKNLVSI